MNTETSECRLIMQIGMWLAHAGKRLKASTEEGMKIILAEAQVNEYP